MKDRPQRSPTSGSLLHTIDSNPDPTLNNPFHWHTMGGGVPFLIHCRPLRSQCGYSANIYTLGLLLGLEWALESTDKPTGVIPTLE